MKKAPRPHTKRPKGHVAPAHARQSGAAAPGAWRRRALLALGLLASLGVCAWWLRPIRRPNVLLVTIDTLRADHVGAYGDRTADTRALDALAARGTLFTNAICQVPLTLPSHASMLTGLLPPSHGVRDNPGFALAAGVPTIAEQFKKAGYRTAAFVSGYPLHRRFGLARGFDVYDDRFPHGDDPTRPYTERRADLTVRAAIAWLAERATAPNRPFFAWIHLFDPHAPYDPPEPYRARFRDRPYDGEIAFADSQLGVLIDDLSKRGLLSNTIVFALADHGEGLGEHREPTHGLFIYDSTIRIPLIVAGPGVSRGARQTTVVRAIDIAPTLLDVARLAPIPAIDGRSLKAALQGRSMPPEGAYAESLFARLSFGWAPLWGWRTEKTMFIDAPRQELYDLAADPAEEHDLSSERRSESARYREILRSILSRPSRASTAPTTAESRERLRALGYTGGAAAALASASMRDPKDLAALAVRVESASTLKDSNPAAAVDEYRAILDVDPGNALARHELALTLSQLKRPEEALKEANRLLAEGDRSGDTLVLVGECYRVLGRFDDALQSFDAAARRDPLAPEPLDGRGRTLALAGRKDEARQAFAAALALSPDDPDALGALADLAIERGDIPEALARLEALHGAGRADPAATLKLGVLLVRQGDIDRAIRLFREVVASQPSNVEALVDLGGALAKAGRAAEAIPYFERAIGDGTRNVVVWNSLAFARLETGDRVGAVDAFRRSLSLQPDQPRIVEALRNLQPHAK